VSANDRPPGRRDRPGGEAGSGGGLSGLDISLLDLRKHRPESPDDPGADAVQDPHSWDDPETGGLRSRTPDTLVGWLGSIALGLIAAGLLAYLFPVFWPVLTDPLVIAGGVATAYTVGVWLHGRGSGWRAARDMVKSVIYTGDDVIARAGEQPDEVEGTTDREHFVPFRSVRYGGFRPRPLRKRDLPYDPRKLRSNGPDVEGDDPVVDRLNATTRKIETETLGTVLLTHAAGLDYDPHARHADRYAPLPTTIDEGAVEDLHGLITALRTELTQQQRRLELLQESNRSLRDLKTAQELPDMERAVQLVERMGDAVPDRDDRESALKRENSRLYQSAGRVNGNGYGGDYDA